MVKKLEDVLLVWHYNPDNDDDAKLIGVYSTQEKAKEAVLSLKDKPGFKDNPEQFEICPYRLNLTAWEEGFITLKPLSKKNKPTKSKASK